MYYKVYCKVSYDEKEIAKRHGARFDKMLKLWYFECKENKTKGALFGFPIVTPINQNLPDAFESESESEPDVDKLFEYELETPQKHAITKLDAFDNLQKVKVQIIKDYIDRIHIIHDTSNRLYPYHTKYFYYDNYGKMYFTSAPFSTLDEAKVWAFKMLNKNYESLNKMDTSILESLKGQKNVGNYDPYLVERINHIKLYLNAFLSY